VRFAVNADDKIQINFAFHFLLPPFFGIVWCWLADCDGLNQAGLRRMFANARAGLGGCIVGDGILREQAGGYKHDRKEY
jgi:hypothetical protein